MDYSTIKYIYLFCNTLNLYIHKYIYIYIYIIIESYQCYFCNFLCYNIFVIYCGISFSMGWFMG